MEELMNSNMDELQTSTPTCGMVVYHFSVSMRRSRVCGSIPSVSEATVATNLDEHDA
jgi:hypothetical protein